MAQEGGLRPNGAHTPGPWTLAPCSHGGAILRRGTEERGNHPQTHLQIVPIEDARLIASAPDLLIALRALLASHPDSPMAEQARRVIAKAEGSAS